MASVLKSMLPVLSCLYGQKAIVGLDFVIFGMGKEGGRLMPARYQETYIKPLPNYAEVDEGPNYQTAQMLKQNLDVAITCAKHEANKGPSPHWWTVEELTYNKQKGWVKTGKTWRSKAAQKEISNKQKRLPGI